MLTQAIMAVFWGTLGTLIVALLLIVTDRPAAVHASPGLDFGTRTGLGQDAPVRQIVGQCVRVYDASNDTPLVILVHGSGWHGQQFHDLVPRLSNQNHARVWVPDLSDHGALTQSAAAVITPRYSYRLNTSYAHRRDWASDVAKLPQWPLIVGAADETMNVTGYQDAMASATSPGQITQVPETGHLYIVDHPANFRVIADLIAAVGPRI